MTAQVSSTPLSQMSGRWLWFGLQKFTEGQWNVVCAQAALWKIQGLHPKVGDGIYRWYDEKTLMMLRDVAAGHGLHVAPYHYCYGPRFGAGQITTEAQMSAWIGKIFGAVVPDIEDEYMGQYDSAESFGKQVRALYNGLWLPTMYANPQTHSVPMLSLNPYMDGWLPQVYFSLWKGLAQSAIEYVYPQWAYFDQRAHQQGQGSLKPTLPIISLSNGVGGDQIAEFISKMQGYGYIGFWHYGDYAPYASAVMNAPLPRIGSGPVAPPIVPSAPAAAPVPLAFNDDDRQVWSLHKPIVINETSAIEQGWLRARYERGWNFGPPMENEHPVVRKGKKYSEQQFVSARASYEVETGLLTWWTANGPVRV